MNQEIKKVYLLVLLLVIQFVLDLSTNKCFLTLKNSKKAKAITILFIHHVISVLSNFGWIFNNKILLKLYLAFPILTLIHWLVNKDKCFLTDSFNKLCGYSHYEYFHDFFYFLGIKKIHPIYFFIVSCIALYKIFKK